VPPLVGDGEEEEGTGSRCGRWMMADDESESVDGCDRQSSKDSTESASWCAKKAEQGSSRWVVEPVKPAQFSRPVLANATTEMPRCVE
jgi:hypothetical protein